MPSNPELPPFDISPSFYRSEPPNPSWKPGDSVNITDLGARWERQGQEGVVSFTPEDENPGFIYKMLISGVVPRPIAFVASVSDRGQHNLAPFSWFNVVSANPALLSISFNQKPAKMQDTSVNIRRTKEFTVNVISEPWVEAANWTSIDAPPGVSEWPGSGLTKTPCTVLKSTGVPLVKESAFSLECELYQAHDFTDPLNPSIITATLILGYIRRIHVHKAVLDQDSGLVDPEKLRAIARLGDTSYGRIGGAFRISRPSWSDENDRFTGEKPLDRQEE